MKYPGSISKGRGYQSGGNNSFADPHRGNHRDNHPHILLRKKIRREVEQRTGRPTGWCESRLYFTDDKPGLVPGSPMIPKGAHLETLKLIEQNLEGNGFYNNLTKLRAADSKHHSTPRLGNGPRDQIFREILNRPGL